MNFYSCLETQLRSPLLPALLGVQESQQELLYSLGPQLPQPPLTFASISGTFFWSQLIETVSGHTLSTCCMPIAAMLFQYLTKFL